MGAASAPPPLNGDAIRNVGRVLPWLARLPGQPDMAQLSADDFAAASDRETREAVAILESSFRKRHESVNAVISAMTDKLRIEVESADPGTVLDPDGSGAQALEEAEKYFRAERDKLRDIRKALDGSGVRSACGASVFDELDRLASLFFGFVQWCQEIRWLVMVHDGVASPSTGKTHKSGAELVSSLTDS